MDLSYIIYNPLDEREGPWWVCASWDGARGKRVALAPPPPSDPDARPGSHTRAYVRIFWVSSSRARTFSFSLGQYTSKGYLARLLEV